MQDNNFFGECSANIRHTIAELVAVRSQSVRHTFPENDAYVN